MKEVGVRQLKRRTVIKEQLGVRQRILTFSLHELGDVGVPGTRLGLGQVHAVEVEVADQVVLGVASHVDGLGSEERSR